MRLCLYVFVWPIVHACKKKENRCLLISVLYGSVLDTTFVSLLWRCQVWMPLPQTSCECYVCECVCVCEAHCVFL